MGRKVALSALMIAGLLTAGATTAATRMEQPVKPGTSAGIARTAPFTIDLPAGWSGGETTTDLYDATRSWRFADDSGRFFVVNIDPQGSDVHADAVWRVNVQAGDRLSVVERGPRCTREEGLCSAMDGRLDLYALASEGGSASMRGHDYYFHFGSTETEDADTSIYQDLLESIRATSAGR